MLALVVAALASTPARPSSGLRPGELLIDAGLGIHMNARLGVPLPSVIRTIESWHPASVRVQLGLLNIGPVTFIVGGDAYVANQTLVNPGLVVRRQITRVVDRIPPLVLRFIPRWLPLPTAGAEADWRWRLRTLGYGGLLTVQLNRLATTPHFSVGVGQSNYSASIVHREDPSRVGSLERSRPAVLVGGGATRTVRGMTVGVALRMSFLIPDSPGEQGASITQRALALALDNPWAVPVEGGSVDPPRRMRPPRAVLSASVGYRFGRRRQVQNPGSNG